MSSRAARRVCSLWLLMTAAVLCRGKFMCADLNTADNLGDTLLGITISSNVLGAQGATWLQQQPQQQPQQLASSLPVVSCDLHACSVEKAVDTCNMQLITQLDPLHPGMLLLDAAKLLQRNRAEEQQEQQNSSAATLKPASGSKAVTNTATAVTDAQKSVGGMTVKLAASCALQRSSTLLQANSATAATPYHQQQQYQHSANTSELNQGTGRLPHAQQEGDEMEAVWTETVQLTLLQHHPAAGTATASCTADAVPADAWWVPEPIVHSATDSMDSQTNSSRSFAGQQQPHHPLPAAWDSWYDDGYESDDTASAHSDLPAVSGHVLVMVDLVLPDFGQWFSSHASNGTSTTSSGGTCAHSDAAVPSTEAEQAVVMADAALPAKHVDSSLLWFGRLLLLCGMAGVQVAWLTYAKQQ